MNPFDGTSKNFTIMDNLSVHHVEYAAPIPIICAAFDSITPSQSNDWICHSGHSH